MSGVLVVPIRLDAISLGTDLDVVGPSVDFTRLPYRDATGRDRNGHLPYVSETLLTAPFQDQDFRLKAGVHLHWALPDALTRLVQNADGSTHIPSVPNRWLVTRTVKDTVQDQWIIESDHLSDTNVSAVSYPIGTAGKPYRHLGRRVPLRLWSRDSGATYLPALTAVGYGEPTFAAHYANCHSVFGCYDPTVTGTPPKHLRYDIVGWYDDLAQDPVTALGADWRNALKTEYAWAVTAATAPTRTVCYAQLTFDTPTTTAATAKPPPAPKVWVGNTPTEALAGHLGAVLPNVQPSEAEALLEAIAYADRLEAKPLDLGASLMEARHAATFRDVPFGTLWTVRRQDETAGVTPQEKQLREALAIPAAVSDLLSRLNAAQQDLDRAGHDLRALRRQLFADWYKYQLCAYPTDATRDSYPDQDEVGFFLQRKMRYLDEEAARATTKAERVTAARAALDTALTTLNATARPARSAFVVQQVPAPPFHLPNEPAVLLTGTAAVPTDRHGQDGAADPDNLMGCAVTANDVPAIITSGQAAALRTDVVAAAGRLGAAVWDPAAFHPITLEWEVEFYPATQGNNLDPADRRYHPDFVTRNFTLPPRGVELKPNTYVPDKAANVYAGSTLLSAGARPVLSARILTYLQANLLPLYLAAGRPAVTPAAFAADPAPVLSWYDANASDARLTLMVAMYRYLAAHEDSNLSATLSGFNDALLMRRLTRQLPIADPLGFPPYQAFAATVDAAVAGENRFAPHPLGDFNPIRAGAMRLLRLRIVDSFGRTRDVDLNGMGTTTELTVPGHPGWVAMPPRIAQPARLTVNWQGADDLGGTSPICGWLVPDNLDLSLAVYAADGTALGSLRALADPRRPEYAQWRPPPGGTLAPIGNAHLGALVERLRTGGPTALGTLLEGLDDTLAQIEPEDYAQHRGRSVLMGNPIAVARLELTLELMGWPAVHQDWNVFRQDMRRSSRETNDFELVRFPIRIGEHTLLNDGVLGFWLENSAREPAGDFHDVRAGRDPLIQALDLPSQYLTLLLDPRGRMHATSGILPTVDLALPVETYRSALGRMAVAFFTGPLLGDSDHVGVPLPNEPGYAWSWRERTRAGWSTLPDPPAPDQRVLAEPTLREGWLVLTPDPDGGRQ
ncbi:hypothetical protein ACFYTC_32485 [Actinomadura nitritigenes]|uniref:hypothetical protein n=1 Tax=Actinomadura nitritigenes TaxID=134602 RepID=UPI00369B2A60